MGRDGEEGFFYKGIYSRGDSRGCLPGAFDPHNNPFSSSVRLLHHGLCHKRKSLPGTQASFLLALLLQPLLMF